jgi:hypothetical protein
LECLAETAVEAVGQVPAELNVLTLVLAYRHAVRLVKQDVRGLQDGVREQANTGVVRTLLLRLVLELRHAGGLAHSRDAVQDPRQLRVLGNLGLDEERALVDVHAAGDVLGCGYPGAPG